VGLAYRLRQLHKNLTAGPLTTAARDEIAAVLTQPEWELFQRFSYPDQWHSYHVLRALADAGYNHPDLLAAALLHDIGKTRYPLSVGDRIAIVVGRAIFPRRAATWGDGSLDGWKRPFVVHARHPAWGAEMAADSGSRARVVELIRRHQAQLEIQQSENDNLLACLQWADDQN
jgi:putative nucleotidyltransferase with HDIG domain